MKIPARYLVALALASGMASAGMMGSAAVGRRAAQPAARTAPQPAEPRGQTATRLPDGRWLVMGGSVDGEAVTTARLVDPSTGTAKEIALSVPRAWHTATVLPDGTVLIAGGIGPGGEVVARSEVFDPATTMFAPLAMTGATARTGASATLLTDGHVLMVGGKGTDGRALAAEVWDVTGSTVTWLASAGATPRSGHTATLLPDGRVLISGGQDASGKARTDAEAVDAVTGEFTSAAPLPAIDSSVPVLAASLPADGAQDVGVEGHLALRFSKPLAIATIADAVSLSSLDGQVPIAAVAAEGGRLAFVTPRGPLAGDTTYALSLAGATDERGVSLTPVTIAFTTKADDKPGVTGATDAEGWLPDGASAKGGWRTNRPDSPWRTLAPLMAPPGTTAISGQVLRLDGRPLADVTLELEGHDTRSDRTGRFLLLLPDVPAARHELEIDGRTANRPYRTYGTFEYGLDVAAGRTTVLPFTIWMPLIDTAHQVTIASPTTSETVIRTPYIAGLELHLPAGTVIKDDDGAVVRTVSITAIPVDRPPFPLPRNADVPVYFTIQPGGAYVTTPSVPGAGRYGSGAWLVYPNYRQEYPGKRIQFYHYEPRASWYVYGLGTVTPNGAQVVPDARTRIHAFTGAMINSGASPPADSDSPGCCPDGKGGDPVGLATGLFSLEQTDLALSDTLPIAVTRSYRSRDVEVRPFGPGTTHPYAMFLHSANQYTEADLVLPDGAKLHYVRISGGFPWSFTDAIFQHVETATTSATPTAFYKSVLAWNGNGWDLTLKDGTVYVFGETAPLQAIRDRYGNTITIAHADGQHGNVTRVTSPHGRWIEFTYNGNVVSQVTDNIGRTVGYTYDPTGNLWKVTDPLGHVTEYTYDSNHNMLTVKNRNGVVYVTNEYTTTADAPTPVGWVKKQTHADTGAYTFAYTVSSGKSTSTDVTDPRGYVRRVTFNTDGYVLQDTHALNQAEEQRTTSNRPSRDNFVRTTTDPHLLQTSMTYDAMGNVASVTRLANTPNPVTTTYTYDSRFNQLATVSDPLNHTTTFGYDNAGNMSSITDPLQHQNTFTYNGQGQLASVTDALQHTTTFGYTTGDLINITDPVGRVTTRLTDSIGRALRGVNPLGETTRYTYDANDQMMTVSDALGGQISFEYFPDGQLQSVTDPNQHTTSYNYDAMGRMASRTDALGRTETFTYDQNGNPSQWTDRQGQITTRSYDPLNRLHQVTYADTSTTTDTYDDRDRVRQIVDSVSGTIAHEYDDLDRLLSETTPQGAITYTYDAANRRATMSVGGQPDVIYAYDDADRLTAITEGMVNVTLQYDDANRRTTLTLPNGIVTEYAYDDANGVIGLTYRTPTATLGTLTYGYDLAGRRTQLAGSWARTGLPPALASAVYDATNELTLWSTETRQYDRNSRLASDGLTSYAWDSRGQLGALSGLVSASFSYDSVGRRASISAGGATTEDVYDGLNPATRTSGSQTTAFMTGHGLDEWLGRIEASGTSSFLTDGLGSTVALTDSSAGLIAQYTYEPFGDTRVQGSASNAAKFTGRDQDPTALYYYRARYYDPKIGRFISEDPIRFDGGPNFYEYVSNNPVNLVDPSGLCAANVTAYIKQMCATAKAAAGPDCPCRVMLIQSGFETGWGTGPFVKANNFFGMHGEGDAGSVQAGQNPNVKVAKYSSPAASFKAYCALARRKGVSNQSEQQFVRDIVIKGGFSIGTQPRYIRQINAMLSSCDKDLNDCCCDK